MGFRDGLSVNNKQTATTTTTMADFLQFDFELDSSNFNPQQELQLYSCSLDSTTDSLPDLQEISTPLLYESKIPSSRNNSIISNNNEDVDQFHLDLTSSNYIPKTIPELNQFDQSKPKTIMSSLQDSNEVQDIIKKGSITIQNNYKRWLSTSTH